ncbi:NUDIX hydrolase [Methylobacterium sp. Leaf399]|uniref:NUDIX domain-containing protein n=1 Tax=unclassified Methylobacterium TaxID=2615210 RepID=UPI000700D0EC|nr:MULTISPECIES: NUDIX hydrolase [unclassified Methylobacterium]KQP54975.1 NUDIX hydrolase [Methylobacterium sp. Leaf108]KQT09129.1 NUDIX hydrolase [Methylobacterium sp. Leaf399]KQT78947.1 NUDIX hydrolase [Methylobacterium sp. Leaf466]
MAPVIRGTRILHDGWSRFLVAEITLEDGSRIKREIEDHGRAVAVLPYDPVRRVALLAEQFRPAAFFAAGIPSLLEVPAGLLDEPDPEEGARREASEEVGVTLRDLEHVTCGWSMPGISTEQMDFYLAPYGAADRHGEGGGLSEEQETITVHEIALSTLAAMSDRGELTDLKTLMLVLTLRVRHPDLFAA